MPHILSLTSKHVGLAVVILFNLAKHCLSCYGACYSVWLLHEVTCGAIYHVLCFDMNKNMTDKSNKFSVYIVVYQIGLKNLTLCFVVAIKK